MLPRKILTAVLSFLVILTIAITLLVFLAFLLTEGSLLLLVGLVVGLGVFGIIIVGGILVAGINIWYILYSLIDSVFESKKKPKKGNYTISRIKRV